MAIDPTTRAAVMAVLDEFKAAVATRDVDRLLALYAPGPEAMAIGTGPDEWHVGRDAMREGLERDFGQPLPFTVDFAPPIVGSHGDVAWLAAGFNGRATVRGELVRLHGRYTAVLRRDGDRWWIVQSHTSLPWDASVDPRSEAG